MVALASPELTTGGRAPVLRRHVAAAVAGNALEFYDFITYAYFAVQIGHAFFPSRTPFGSLMLSLGAFGAGFILRPIGAIVIGRYGDRVGRKPAMLLSLALMGVSILGLAATPGYATIGVAAPILALLWRMLQGFAVGGEVGPTTAFLVEAAAPGRRGFYASWQAISQSAASVASGFIGVTVAHLAGAAGLEAWGWRLALLVGAIILPFGYWLRRTLPETLHSAPEAETVHPAEPKIAGHSAIFLIGLAQITAGTIGTYALTYMTTYAITTLGIPTEAALGVPIVGGVCSIAGCLIGGPLTDRLGRRPFLIWPRVVILIALMPLFNLIVRDHSATTLLTGIGLISFTGGLTAGALYAGLAESIHKHIRGSGFGVIYAVAVAVFGGSTQPLIAWLIHVTGDPLAPAWLMLASTALGLAASIAFPESAPIKLAQKGN